MHAFLMVAGIVSNIRCGVNAISISIYCQGKIEMSPFAGAFGIACQIVSSTRRDRLAGRISRLMR
jgi:hypothetical protein